MLQRGKGAGLSLAKPLTRAIRFEAPVHTDDLVLEALRRQFDVEEGRAQSLNSRGVGLAGFGSVILSLLTLSISSGQRPDAIANQADIPRALLVAALGFLVLAVGTIVLGVIHPRRPEDLRGKDLLALRGKDPEDARSDLLVRLEKAVTRHREINDSKAAFLTGAAGSVMVAVALSAMAGAMIVLG